MRPSRAFGIPAVSLALVCFLGCHHPEFTGTTVQRPVANDLTASPAQSANFGVPLSAAVRPPVGNNSLTLSKVNVAANDLVWSPVDQMVYLSVASANGTNASTIVALNPQTGAMTESSSQSVRSMSDNAMGIQLQSQSRSTTSGRLHFDAFSNFVYSDSGEIIDPATNNVTGTFPLASVPAGDNNSSIMVPDGSLNTAYFVGKTDSEREQGSYTLEAFDLTHHTFLGAVPLTGISGTPLKIVRWGANGLAILTGDPDGNGATGDGVYLLSGSFVTSPAQ